MVSDPLRGFGRISRLGRRVRQSADPGQGIVCRHPRIAAGSIGAREWLRSLMSPWNGPEESRQPLHSYQCPLDLLGSNLAVVGLAARQATAAHN